MRGECPTHPDRSRSLYVSLASDVFYCFACMTGGGATKWVMLRDRARKATDCERATE